MSYLTPASSQANVGRCWRGPDTFHLTAFGAYRARRRWMREVRGRDSYVYRLPGWRLRRFKTTRIDYAPPAPASR